MRGATNAAAAAGGEEMCTQYSFTSAGEHTLPKYCRMLLVDGMTSTQGIARGAFLLTPGTECEVGTATVTFASNGRSVETTGVNYTINAIAFW